MVDYSKWDRMDLSSDEDDDGDEVHDGSRPAPAVYKIEEGASFTIPGRNVTINPSTQPKATTTTSTSSAQRVSPPDASTSPVGHGSSMEQSRAQSSKPVLAARQNVVEKLTRNGAETADYFWAQADDAVTISLKVPFTTCKAKEVKRISVDPFKGSVDVHIARTIADVDSGEPEVWDFSDTLYGPIEGIEDDTDIDWSLATVPPPQPLQHGQDRDGGMVMEGQVQRGTAQEEGQRVLQLELRKKNLGGVVLWWKSAFKGHPEIDTMSISDRKKATATSSSQTFMDNWREAQRMFKEKMKHHEKTPIDLGDAD